VPNGHLEVSVECLIHDFAFTGLIPNDVIPDLISAIIERVQDEACYNVSADPEEIFQKLLLDRFAYADRKRRLNPQRERDLQLYACGLALALYMAREADTDAETNPLEETTALLERCGSARLLVRTDGTDLWDYRMVPGGLGAVLMVNPAAGHLAALH
jgi:hypothetical protein